MAIPIIRFWPANVRPGSVASAFWQRLTENQDEVPCKASSYTAPLQSDRIIFKPQMRQPVLCLTTIVHRRGRGGAGKPEVGGWLESGYRTLKSLVNNTKHSETMDV